MPGRLKQPNLYEMHTQLKNLQCLIMEVLYKCSQHQNLQCGYLLCETCELHNTPEISSDLSEVLD